MDLSKKVFYLKFYCVKCISHGIMRLKFFLFNISHGKNITFYGFTHLFKHKNAIITLGSNNEFRSFKNSNLIGINRPCSLSAINNNSIIKIGNNCGFSGTVIAAFIKIEIQDNVKCGANTLITDSDWHPEDSRAGIPKPIIIEENVWIGEGVKVLKGVTIGKNSVIGAGSVVVKSIPANVIAAGNPCKIIRAIKNEL